MRYKSGDLKRVFLLAIWGAVVHSRSFRIWFDWETVRFFVQPRPGRFRILGALTGSWVDLSDYGIHTASATFRPLMSLLFQLEAFLFRSHAPGYHLVNFAAHILCGIMLYYLALKWRCAPSAAFLAALFFLSHPLGTQPLWILGDVAEQFVLLGGSIALLFFRRSTFLSLLGLTVALLSKETAVTIPLWIMAQDLILFRASLRTEIRRMIARHAPYWLILALYLGYRSMALHGIGGYHSVSLLQFRYVPEIFMRNISWLVCMAHPLAAIYIAGLLGTAVFFAVKHPGARMASAWGILFLLPVFNLCNKWYLYTPTAAFSIFLGGVITVLYQKFSRKPVQIGSLIIILIMSLESWAELFHQQRNAAVPMHCVSICKTLHPELPKGATVFFAVPKELNPDTLKGHWFNPRKFIVKALKSPAESIVWDLNATRYLPDGTPVWTRSVEAGFRLAYDDIHLKVRLTPDRAPWKPGSGQVVVPYRPGGTEK